MRGEVLYYGDADAAGVIAGDDGRRYAFGPADLKALREVRAGMRVDFVADGDRATEIYFLDEAASVERNFGELQESLVRGAEGVRAWLAPSGRTASSGTAQTDRTVTTDGTDAARFCDDPAPRGGPVGLIRHALRRYADGSGRAGRREFAVFVLFALLTPIVAFLFDLAWNNLVFGPERLSYGYIFPLLTIVTVLGLVAPLLATASRRLHDLGLTGWLVLLLVVLMFLQPLGLIALVALAVLPSAGRAGPDAQPANRT